MAQVEPQPLFSVGTRVFTRDGRSGLIQSVDFAPAVGGFRYILEGVADIFEEDDLQDIPFTAVERLAPLDALRAVVELAIIRNPGRDIRNLVGREIGVPFDVLDDTESQPGGGTLEGALGFWAARGFTLEGGPPSSRVFDVEEPIPPVVVPPPVVIDIGPQLAELEASLKDFVIETVSLTNRRLDLLQSTVTDALSEMESSLLALEQAAQEATGSDLKGLFGLVGELLLDPLGFLLEKSGDAIQREILDGLTR